MALSLQRSACPVRAASRAPALNRAPRLVMRASKQQEEKTVNAGHAVVAATIAAGVLLGAQMVAPSEALAARSGGRAGASRFSASRAASRAAPSRAAPSVNSYSTTIVSAPPVYSYSPFGFGGGFGFGGVRLMPVIPIPFFGGLLQFMFLMLIVSVVFNVIKGAIGAASGGSKSKSQDWDDL